MKEMAFQSWPWNYVDDKSIVPTDPLVANKPTAIIVPNPIVTTQSTARAKRYKAFFKHLTAQEKVEFKSQRCVVPISLGQRYHEGKRFEALLKLINRSFSSCTIIVADVLQRHSLEIEHPNKTEAERAELAAHSGQEWMQRNRAYINQLTIPHDITFWNEWITQPAFQIYKDKVEALYIADKEYKNACDSMANQFLSRTKNKYGDSALAPNATIKYILEESAVICLFAKVGYDVEIYPCTTKIPISLEYISTKLDVTKKYRSPLVAIERA